jgi:hypothetical protein
VRAALRRTIPLSAAVAWLSATAASAGPFPATLELSDLDGKSGFVLTGIAEGDAAGYAVSGAGDVNGDGTDDIVIGAYGADPGGRSAAGQTYVIFGAPDIGALGTLPLASLDGSNGYALNGINRVENNDFSGLSAGGAGDVNGDGVGDVIVGAFLADPPGREDAGQAYIVFGGANVGLAGQIELAQLDGRNGFTLNGWYERGETGCCVASGGDVNGDGYGDFIIGAVWADPGLRLDAGQTYVVFGGPDIGAEGVVALKLLDGNDGFAINGIDLQDFSARAVGGAGDVNGDGFDDIIIGAIGADAGEDRTGEAYVVFGGSGPFPPGLELSALDGSNGFVMGCVDFADYCGISVNVAGDVNGDGLDDVIVGALYADTNDDVNQDAGESYVVFGAPDVGGEGFVDLARLDGRNGFVLRGASAREESGWQASGAGDINADGVDDIVIGAARASPGGRTGAGAAYVVYGGPEVGGNGAVELSGLDGDNGFVIHGIDEEDEAGLAATRAEDVNADGIDDLIIGAHFADPNGMSKAGEAYVVFGRAADTDGDGIGDDADNCTQHPNADQRDTNGDDYGNRCDPDLTDNGIVNFEDLGALRSVFMTGDDDADLDGNGIVNFVDLGIMKSFFFGPPGPSGDLVSP